MREGKGAASAAPEFPRTLAAVKAAEGDQWKIADALLYEVGPPSKHGTNDGSRARLEECGEYLAERGFDYGLVGLREMRDTAYHFPEGARASSCSFQAHRKAGSPEILEEAIRRNDGNPPSTRFVEQLRRELREQEEAAERKREEAKRKRAEERVAKEREKVAKAKREEDRRKAERRAKEAEARAAMLARQQAEAERKRDEKRHKAAAEKAAKIAEQLEDKDVAAALVEDDSVGSLRVQNAVRAKNAGERRKAVERNKQNGEQGGMPLPAWVPVMVEKIGGWGGEMRNLTGDIAELPADVWFGHQLVDVVRELRDAADGWLLALGVAEIIDDADHGRVAVVDRLVPIEGTVVE